LFHLIRVVILFLRFLEYFCIMEYQNNLKNEFKQIRPLGPDAAHDRTAPLDQALWRPAKPAHPGTESGLTRPSRLTGSTRRARPHCADAHGARGMAGLPRGRRWPRCTGKTTSSTSTSSHTRRAPTRRREAREATGHRERLWAHRRRGGGGGGGSAYDGLPCFRSGG
jgi:hypothetical protein